MFLEKQSLFSITKRNKTTVSFVYYFVKSPILSHLLVSIAHSVSSEFGKGFDSTSQSESQHFEFFKRKIGGSVFDAEDSIHSQCQLLSLSLSVDTFAYFSIAFFF